MASPSGTGRLPPGQKPFWMSISSNAFMISPFVSESGACQAGRRASSGLGAVDCPAMVAIGLNFRHLVWLMATVKSVVIGGFVNQLVTIIGHAWCHESGWSGRSNGPRLILLKWPAVASMVEQPVRSND